ncbi:MAG: acetylornithine transaminase, partial [Actinomycetota bacterium]|nr:acetylornithine transaminase [Actinomycetota bacterium]
ALDAGFIVNDCTPSVLRTAPPLIIDTAQLDSWLAALPAVLDECTTTEEGVT